MSVGVHFSGSWKQTPLLNASENISDSQLTTIAAIECLAFYIVQPTTILSLRLTHSWEFEPVVDNIEEGHVNEIPLSENMEAKLTRNLRLR